MRTLAVNLFHLHLSTCEQTSCTREDQNCPSDHATRPDDAALWTTFCAQPRNETNNENDDANNYANHEAPAFSMKFTELNLTRPLDESKGVLVKLRNPWLNAPLKDPVSIVPAALQA